MAVIILTMLLRAWRWKYLLQPVRAYKTSELFPPVMIGFMANNILPIRLGEIVRAYSLGTVSKESRSAIFGTIVIERVFDSLALMLIFWIVFMSVPVPGWIRKFGIVSLVLNVGAIAALVLFRKREKLLIRILLWPMFFLSARIKTSIENVIGKFSEGLNVVGANRTLGVVIFGSLVLWIIIALSNYFVFLAFGIYPHPAASFILLLFVAAAVMLPSAPGFVGVFQVGVIGAFTLMNSIGLLGYNPNWGNLGLLSASASAFYNAPVPPLGTICDAVGLFGISKGQALSFSIVLWLSQYLPVTLLGLYYLKRQHLTLRVESD